MEADVGAAGEPPLAVNHPQRLVHFHRSEDGTVFVELTTLWRWLSGNLKGTQGEERLAKTLRRRGYNGASWKALSVLEDRFAMRSFQYDLRTGFGGQSRGDFVGAEVVPVHRGDARRARHDRGHGRDEGARARDGVAEGLRYVPLLLTCSVLFSPSRRAGV